MTDDKHGDSTRHRRNIQESVVSSECECVSEGELRKLIEGWRETAREARESGRVDDAQVLGSCASELEGLLNDG
jgi:hypothetical protein